MAKPTQTLGDWLSHEPFALTMSSGFFGFFAHCGMLCALEENGLLPQRITGSSAGALVGGLWAAGVSSQDIAQALFALQRRDFWDPKPGLGLLRGEKFHRLLEDILPVTDLEQARVPVHLSVYDLRSKSTHVLCTGEVAAAIRASCALPILFQPVRHQGRRLLDGGILDRPGLQGMPATERTFYHHLASRSPWRRKKTAALHIPKRRNMATLTIEQLPRVSPFKLHVGRKALMQARETTLRALDQSLDAAATLRVRSYIPTKK